MNEWLKNFLWDEKLWKWLISDIWTKENYRILGDNFLTWELGILSDISENIKTILFIYNNPKYISFYKNVNWKDITLFSHTFDRKLIIDFKEIEIPKGMWNIFNIVDVNWKLLFLTWDKNNNDICIYNWNIDPHSYNPEYNLGCYYLLDENLCWSEKKYLPYISDTYRKEIIHYCEWNNICINGINILSFKYGIYKGIFIIDLDSNFKVIDKKIDDINILENWKIEFKINWSIYEFSKDALDFVKIKK